MDYRPFEYLYSQSWRIFKDCDCTMYRFNTYHDLYMLFDNLRIYYFDIYKSHSIGEILQQSNDPLQKLIDMFDNIKGFPINDKSACKRLNMLLRWMSRKDSPVDLGLWNIDPSKLIIPVDTHVHRMALDLGLTKRRQADMKTALEITDAMRERYGRRIPPRVTSPCLDMELIIRDSYGKKRRRDISIQRSKAYCKKGSIW